MAKQWKRRDVLRMGLTATGLLAMTVPEWAIPALAQGETVVPFTDIPPNFKFGGNAPTRTYDIRHIDGLVTPADEFFSISHYGVPEVDLAAYRLQVTGMVNKPVKLTPAEIRSRPAVQLPAGYECSGNGTRRIQGLCSCGKFTGARLRDLLKDVGVQDRAREVLFFGADRGTETTPFRRQSITLDSQFIRSMSLQDAVGGDAIIAYELNGKPLDAREGAPARLIMPGWYGVSNVKWLTGIHLQQERFVGHFQARWYRTVRGEEIGGEMKYNETEITRMRIKSVISRVTRSGSNYRIMGFVLNDGTPLRSVEVQVDGGAWQAAKLDPSNTKYSWKLFRFDWKGLTPGKHTIVSRATDINGTTQATEAELASKKTFLEHNAQFPRTVMVS